MQTLSELLEWHFAAKSRCVYIVTDEEDRVFRVLESSSIGDKAIQVYNAAYGSLSFREYINVYKNAHTHSQIRHPGSSTAPTTIHEFLIQAQNELQSKEKPELIYIITDPERWLGSPSDGPMVTRRVLNLCHQLYNTLVRKRLIFIGHKRIQGPVQRYLQVIQDPGLSQEEILAALSEPLTKIAEKKTGIQVQKNIEQSFTGMTSWDAQHAFQLVLMKKTLEAKDSFTIEKHDFHEYKKTALQKTDLVHYLDTKEDFTKVGGVERFKVWALKTALCWTEGGKAFGLKPPKGVLLTGVWGCGKSISTKALGNTWKIPVIQLEMGKLRSSRVGESEDNTYKALHTIEKVSPCILMVDEAEKSFSGSQSSSHTDGGTGSRMLGILSTWLQETTAPVCMALTTNSLDKLPPELINRMDERFFFDLPSAEERIDILNIHLRKVKQTVERYDLALLADLSENMVGREIQQAIESAMVESFYARKPYLVQEYLETILTHKPRLYSTMRDEVQKLIDWVGYDAEADEGIRARYASKPRRVKDC